MWDVQKFKKRIKELKDLRYFNGREIKTREIMYEMISMKLYVGIDTVKSWTRPDSNGPKDKETIEMLEKYLGVEENYFDTPIEKMGGETEVITLDYFQKKALFKCYTLVKNYINDDDVENEDCYSRMRVELSKYKIAIPTSIYDTFEEYVDEHISPIVYDHDNTFNISKYNFKDEDLPDNPDITKDDYRIMATFLQALYDIELDFDKFALANIQPLLIN